MRKLGLKPKVYHKPSVVRQGAAMASGACPKCTTGNCGINYRTGW